MAKKKVGKEKNAVKVDLASVLKGETTATANNSTSIMQLRKDIIMKMERLTDRIIALEQRIDRIVNAIDKSKKIRGL